MIALRHCLVLCLFLICYAFASDTDYWLRGVHHSLRESYQAAKESGSFKCIQDDIVLGFHKFNDGICDCNDGSDEPGTSGCSEGVFHCKNEGSRPQRISSSKVDDGICDCCDGSDEPDGVCSNTCQQRDATWLAALNAEAEKHQSGAKIRKEAIKAAAANMEKIRTEKERLQDELSQLQNAFSKAYQRGDGQTVKRIQANAEAIAQRQRILARLNDPSDFGPKKEFAALFPDCYSITLNEKDFKGGSFEEVAQDYTFHFCPLQYVSQQKVGDDNAVLLGQWKRWATTPAKSKKKPEKDSAELEPEDEWVMEYTDGEQCWGVDHPRQVTVTVVCHLQNELLMAKENGKCNYELRFGTPLVCDEKRVNLIKRTIRKADLHSQQITHDEL